MKVRMNQNMKKLNLFLIWLLKMLINFFTKMKNLEIFQEDPRVIEIDEKIKSINGVYLREKNGFIQLIKSHPKEN